MRGLPSALLFLLAAIVAAGCGATRGGPVASPVSGQRCFGMPVPLCAKVLADTRKETFNGVPVVGIAIVCTASTGCTQGHGEASITRTFANGETHVGAMSWAGPEETVSVEPTTSPNVSPGVGMTPLPIVPTCLGVVELRCLERAAELLGDAPPGAVAGSIEVRCQTVCTLASGEGTTFIRFVDGTSKTVDWAYRN